MLTGFCKGAHRARLYTQLLLLRGKYLKAGWIIISMLLSALTRILIFKLLLAELRAAHVTLPNKYSARAFYVVINYRDEDLCCPLKMQNSLVIRECGGEFEREQAPEINGSIPETIERDFGSI